MVQHASGNSNREYADSEDYFLKCCAAVHVEPTRRQASKFRRREGWAYREGRRILAQQAKEGPKRD